MSTGINGNIQVPELIVVAVPNTNRTRDLTPTHSTVGGDGEESPFLEASGGGDAFLDFLRNELIPHVEARYRTKPYRILVGHSFGGLLALHAFLEAPDVFQGYVAIDPSLWWDDEVLVQRIRERGHVDGDRPRTVYISLANNREEPDVPSFMETAGNAFARHLGALAGPHLRSTHTYFGAEDHGSVPLISLYHGLTFLFEGYKPSLVDVRERPSSLVTHFERVSSRLGVDLPPPERYINGIAYAMLSNDEVETALELFRLNVSMYPMSYNVYHRLASAHARNGDTQLAIENYEESLLLHPDNENAKEELEKLRGEQ